MRREHPHPLLETLISDDNFVSVGQAK
jgi:hypothetical protein